LLLVLGGCSARGELAPSAVNKSDGQSKASPPKDDATQITKIDVSYSLAKSQVTLHEPVILTFTVKNSLTQAVNLDLGADRKQNFIFTIKQPDGTTIQLPQLRREGISRMGRLSVDPGKTYTQEILLNEWYEFPMIGKYELSARLAKPMQNSEGASIEPAEFHSTLDIQPRNAERLEQIAAGLADQVSASSSYEEAAQAALKLSYINDPVAVPYMGKVLSSNHMVEAIAIAGLERVGDEEAIHALTDASVRQKGETRELARAALDRVKKKH
jgi:hypothetical protein